MIEIIFTQIVIELLKKLLPTFIESIIKKIKKRFFRKKSKKKKLIETIGGHQLIKKH